MRCVAACALAFAEEDFFAANFALRRLCAVEAIRHRVELGRGREIEHVLKLRHVADPDAIKNVHTFLDGMDFITIEVGGALFELVWWPSDYVTP